MTTYVEVAVSGGPGKLIEHRVIRLKHESSLLQIDRACSVQTLTEQEAQAFYTMHGNSWVAV